MAQKKQKRAAWLDHDCSLKIQYFYTKLHIQFIHYLLKAVMNFQLQNAPLFRVICMNLLGRKQYNIFLIAWHCGLVNVPSGPVSENKRHFLCWTQQS